MSIQRKKDLIPYGCSLLLVCKHGKHDQRGGYTACTTLAALFLFFFLFLGGMADVWRRKACKEAAFDWSSFASAHVWPNQVVCLPRSRAPHTPPIAPHRSALDKPTIARACTYTRPSGASAEPSWRPSPAEYRPAHNIGPHKSTSACLDARPIFFLFTVICPADLC